MSGVSENVQEFPLTRYTAGMKARGSLASMAEIALAAFLVSTPLSIGQQVGLESHRKATEKVLPHYPEMAKTLRLSGNVRLAVRVAPNGKVIAAEVLGGHPLLAQAAADAVQQWRFESAPQETQEIVSLTFQP
jgi:TonB family protein